MNALLAVAVVVSLDAPGPTPGGARREAEERVREGGAPRRVEARSLLPREEVEGWLAW
jgi:hypothetical protein